MSGTIAVKTHRESLHFVLMHVHIHLLEDIFILILFVTLNVNSSGNFNTAHLIGVMVLFQLGAVQNHPGRHFQ